MIQLADISLCLTMANRPDRRKQAIQEFGRVNIRADLFYAFDGEDARDSFNRSQFEMMREAISGPAQTAFMSEDDIIFRNLCHLETAFNELPPHWDILYLGANITMAKPDYYSPHLCRIYKAWTTHAVIYRRRVMEYIVKNYDWKKEIMFDDWLSNNVLNIFDCYIVNPMVAWQRPGNSDLWQRSTDYTPCFIKGDEMMKNL